MKKKLISAISVTIILSIFLAFTAFAVGSAKMASNYIVAYNTGISKSGTTVSVSYSITGKSTMTSIGATSIVIYEKNGSSAWSAVKTFTYPATTSLRSSNSVTHTSSVSYNGVSGRQYYAVVNFYAGNSSGSDTAQDTTSTIVL